MKPIRTINPLPYHVYLWSAVFLALVGLADSIYLAISHYRVYTDIGYKSFCTISRAFNCDTVSQSPYAIMLSMPLAIWGVIGYSFILILLYWAGNNSAGKQRIWSLIFWIMLVFSVHSVILALISTYRIRSYCILCIVSYGVNFALLFHVWLIGRRFSDSGLIENTRRDILFLWDQKANSVLILTIFLAAVVSSWIFIPSYWNYQPPRLTADMPTGFTASGYPWIGAENAELEITEFADYECFQCRKMHFYLRQLMAENPTKIKIIHHHYPMDHEFNPIVKERFHVGSGKLALLAVYAALKNKFWQMNDLLYDIAAQKKPLGTKKLAEMLDLNGSDLARSINDPAIRHRLKHDIYIGNKLGITGTPAYVIDGQIYQGQIPPEIIRKILDR